MVEAGAGQPAGRFITLEGGEGVGKSTQAGLLASRLRAAGRTLAETREPGGTPFAERVRRLLLSGAAKPLGPEAETLLFYAARRDHVACVIAPALQRGDWVISDRFADSTCAYQGAGQGVSPALLAALDRLVLAPARPHLTVVLDAPAEVGARRARSRAMGADRFETEELSFHERLRHAFLRIAEEEPGRCVVVDATPEPHRVAEAIWSAVAERLLPGETTSA